jgi:GT2 family glycosyltransferase
MSFSPVKVLETDLSEPASDIAVDARYTAAQVLARWHGEPVAIAVVPLSAGRATAAQVAEALWPAVKEQVAARYAAAGWPARVPAMAGPAVPASPGGMAGPDLLAEHGVRLPWPPSYLVGRAAALRNAPSATVIVCTTDRAERPGAGLTAVLAQDYPDFDVIVVDNAPATDAVADLVGRLRADSTARGVPLRRIVEPRPGRSWARNAGLAAATGRIVAYLDDDERPDRHWLAELARGFAAGRRVVGVSGLMLPAELETPSQALYEQFGGHGKGRGLTPEVFDAASHARQHPLYPLPAFGVGASLAFDRAALLRIGGFDVALGAGPPDAPGEDTAAVADVMLDGGTFVYWPGAIMWHHPGLSHRPGTPVG